LVRPAAALAAKFTAEQVLHAEKGIQRPRKRRAQTGTNLAIEGFFQTHHRKDPTWL
jgi:hypothetical protein